MTKLRRNFHITQKIKPYIYCPLRYGNRLVWCLTLKRQRRNSPSENMLHMFPFLMTMGNLFLKTAIDADRTGKPPLRCSLLLHSSLTPRPSQWDCRQNCKYTLGATFVIISQNVLIARHKLLGVRLSHSINFWACGILLTARPGLK